jgi:type I restriction enzyme S subunit
MSEVAEMTRVASEVPDGWRQTRLDHVAELCLGKMLDKEKNRGEPRPYLANMNVRWGSFDLQDLREMRFEEREFERYGLRSGDIVMCEGGEPGRCAIWLDEVPGMMIQKALHRIRPRKGTDSHYLYYALAHGVRSGSYDELMTGSGIKHLPGNQVAKLKVLTPPLEEQRRIAEVMRSVDDAIATADAVIVGLETVASIVAERAFADPDNVELEHEVVTFGDLFDIKGGNQPPKSSFIYQPKDGYVRLLQIRDFESDDKPAYISEKSSNVRCGTDDILIARYGASVGRILTGKTGAYNVALTKIVFRDRKILRRYAYHWLKSDYFQDRIIAVSNRSAQAGFNKEDLFPTKIALPPLAQQAEIAEALDDLERAIRANRTDRQQMNEVKGSLLDDLLSGHVRVPA